MEIGCVRFVWNERNGTDINSVKLTKIDDGWPSNEIIDLPLRETE